MPNSPRTNVYVDGFNLYYGAAKNTRLKWVNVVSLAQAVLPGLVVNQTRYFTAMVKSDPLDPQQKLRQETYIRALETLPNLSVHLGRYQYTKCRARNCNPPPDTVLVHKTEEKGSDVNIATYMLADAFRGVCEQMVVMTNDSDLAEPIRITNNELGIRVIVLNPHSEDTAARKNAQTGGNHKAHPSYHLKAVAFRLKNIRSHGNNSHMTQAQFPHLLQDAVVTITIPAAWT